MNPKSMLNYLTAKYRSWRWRRMLKRLTPKNAPILTIIDDLELKRPLTAEEEEAAYKW